MTVETLLVINVESDTETTRVDDSMRDLRALSAVGELRGVPHQAGDSLEGAGFELNRHEGFRR
jgi:hypothetical protein